MRDDRSMFMVHIRAHNLGTKLVPSATVLRVHALVVKLEHMFTEGATCSVVLVFIFLLWGMSRNIGATPSGIWGYFQLRGVQGIMWYFRSYQGLLHGKSMLQPF